MSTERNNEMLSEEKQPISIDKRDEKITIKKVASSDIAKAAARCN